MNNFSELSLSPLLSSNLSRNKFVTPTEVQSAAIPPALAGRDVIGTAQTGTGKTLAFVLPILESLIANPVKAGVQALILTPTRELAMQINETFALMALGTGIRSAVVVGGLNEQTQLRAIRNGARIVIATPGRLCDFLDRKLVKLSASKILVLDEADRMLDMGFLPSIKRILGELPTVRQTLFFSATIEASVAKLVNAHVTDPVRIAIGSITKPAENVDLRLYEVDKDRKLGLLLAMLKKEQGTFLVFARTKHGTDRLAKGLQGEGVKTARIHGDRTQNQRVQALKGFQNGDYRVLVATDVAARGIHVDGISHVVNYDLPQAPEDFIHRVGRTGRAGARGIATTFATPSERGDVRLVEKALKLKLERCEVPAEALVARKVVVLPVAHEQRRSGEFWREGQRKSRFRR